MEKNTIYIRVDNKRHVFRVPEGVSLDTIINTYKDQIGLSDAPLSQIRAATLTPMGTPLNQFRISDGSEIIILTDALSDYIEYDGTE